jgi:hypothetical protein
MDYHDILQELSSTFWGGFHLVGGSLRWETTGGLNSTGQYIKDHDIMGEDQLDGMAWMTNGWVTRVQAKTRYAWAPGSEAVVEVLEQEAVRRGLSVRRETFLRRAPNEVQQEWSNILIDLPGGDARRWPVVLAAHWDGARSDLADSYLRALNLNDNASGIAVALEAAGAMSRRPHRAPIIVAFLAGGYHEAAGAHALLESLGGKVTAWVELDGVGVPERWPWSLNVHLEGHGKLSRFPWSVHQAFRRAGLVAKDEADITARHTGGSLAAARGIPSLVLRTRTGDEDADLDTPPVVERERLSPELMVLLTKVLATTVVNLAGAP